MGKNGDELAFGLVMKRPFGRRDGFHHKFFSARITLLNKDLITQFLHARITFPYFPLPSSIQNSTFQIFNFPFHGVYYR